MSRKSWDHPGNPFFSSQIGVLKVGRFWDPIGIRMERFYNPSMATVVSINWLKHPYKTTSTQRTKHIIAYIYIYLSIPHLLAPFTLPSFLNVANQGGFPTNSSSSRRNRSPNGSDEVSMSPNSQMAVSSPGRCVFFGSLGQPDGKERIRRWHKPAGSSCLSSICMYIYIYMWYSRRTYVLNQKRVPKPT